MSIGVERGTSPGPPEPEAGEGISRSVARALRILLDVARDPRSPSFSELQRRHRVPKATLHKLLGTLETLNFLRRDAETGRYSVGVATLEISAAAAARPEDLPGLLGPILRRLVAEWNETCHFGVLDGGEDVILHRLDPADQVVRLGPLRTSRNPAHATAGGLAALVAGGAEARIDTLPETLPQVTANTITTRDALAARLRRVREDGYALDLEEAYLGVRCVAAAVAVAGWPVLYVSFSLPLQRAEIGHLRALATPLIAAAREIETILSVLPRA